MEPVLDDVNDEQTDTDQEPQTDTDRTDGEESNTTPSQSRSSSIRPQQQPVADDSVDLFDGYSFKGRHSVLIDDDEEDGSEEEESEEDEEADLLTKLEAVKTTPPDSIVEEDVPEPKTPEARPAPLPEPVIDALPPLPAEDTDTISEHPEPEPATPVLETTESEQRRDKELPQSGTLESAPPTLPEKDAKPKITTVLKAPAARPAPNRGTRNRREKSGVPALDRYLSDAVEDTEATEREDDEDDDWDFVEAVDGEDRNGAKGTSLFARGVVDRYRLAVFRKASTPSQRSAPRSFSGMSKNSDATISESADSPSPSQRRGRAPGSGLTFRKHPRQFLRPKSPPPSSFSSKSSGTAKSFNHSNSNTFSAASSSGLLTPSPSFGSSLPMSPSLKSKESAVSVGTQSLSSDQSGNGESGAVEIAPRPVVDTIKGSPIEEPEKLRNKKLKKYKENAEKVFSLFSSPRQPS